jgi:hypothetical protein
VKLEANANWMVPRYINDLARLMTATLTKAGLGWHCLLGSWRVEDSTLFTCSLTDRDFNCLLMAMASHGWRWVAGHISWLLIGTDQHWVCAQVHDVEGHPIPQCRWLCPWIWREERWEHGWSGVRTHR